MTSRSTPYAQTWHAVRSGRSVIQTRSGPAAPRSARLAGPSRSATRQGAKGHRPPSIAKPASAKDHAGLGGIHPKDRDDPGDRTGQQGRCAAEPLAGLLGDQHLVGGSRPSRGRIPGQHLGAVALADPLDQGLPVGKPLGRGPRRFDWHRRRLAHATSLSTVHPGQQPTPHNCLVGAPQTPHLPRKGVLDIYRCAAQTATSLLIAAVTSARTSTATIIAGTKLSD